MQPYLNDPWLVSIWPGTGSVATPVGDQIIDQLAPRRLESLPVDGFFDVDRIDVRDGVAQTSWVPDPGLYGWRHPSGGRDLLFAIGDAQPTARAHLFCQSLIERAKSYGCSRVLTFGAIPRAMSPDQDPNVFGVPNRAELLDELDRSGLLRLDEGRIASLNGVLLAAASEVGLDAVCLLSEIPFFAVGMPNPKASLALLNAFAELCDVEFDASVLEHRAGRLESRLVELFDRLGRTGQMLQEVTQSDEEDEPLSPDRRRIENLFRAAERDRSRAFELKTELDRLRVFTEYEDRFLDLFR